MTAWVTANDTNGWTDVFLRDLVANTTLLVSLNAAGTAPGNRLSSTAVMAADGRTIVFQSFASDLASGDLNNAKDVFMLRLNAGDSDHDGLPDDWEIAYFGDLAQDGEGDFDHDGSTNRQEYLAGTNPANNASVFQVLTLTALSNGQTTLLWSAVAGRTYRVQFKDDLERPGWTDLGGEVTADGTQASAVDPDTSAASHRFYRVVLVR